jgi:hypothetical protein
MLWSRIGRDSLSHWYVNDTGRLLASLLTIAVTLVGCGGNSTTPPPPRISDFTLSVSPLSASAVLGNATSAITVSAVPKNGFNDTINVTLQGLPTGIDASPGSSFSLQPGVSQSLTLSVSGTAPLGEFTITLAGSSSAISHCAELVLTTEPVISVHTFQSGSQLVLESQAGADVARVGVETLWGGSIVEVSLNGTNFVNLSDTGREVQLAQYDGNAQYDACAGCTGVFGWNPVQGGDKYVHGSPVLAQLMTADSLYIKAQGYQWNPDDKGGGPGQPVLGDTYVEATVSAVANHAFTFKMHYKVTHFGTDAHANSVQEVPAVYVNLGYDRFATYEGTAPWTNGTVSLSTMPQLPNFSPRFYAPEQWAAFVDSGDSGLAVYFPGLFPYVGGFAAAGSSGPTGTGTNYFAPLAAYTFGPNSVQEGDIYLVAGDYKHARQVVYDLHNQIPEGDIVTPFGVVDSPAPNSQVTGTTAVAGWAFDNETVSKVDVYVDGLLAGTATYGGSRPDVANDFPNAPAAIGYSFSLDTRQYGNGAHTIEVKALDGSGNLAVLPRVPVTVQN